MSSDDDQYAVLRELLESGALSRKDVSEETLKLVYGGEANVPAVPTVDKSPDTSSAQLPPKVEQFRLRYSQIRAEKTPSQAEPEPVDDPPRPSNEKLEQSDDGQTSKKSRGLRNNELSNYFYRQQLQDLILLKDLVEIGLVPESEFESIKDAIIRNRRPYYPFFKREAEEPSRRVDIGAALTAARLLQRMSVSIAFLGFIAGIFVATRTVDIDCSLYGCDSTHPYVGIGIGLIINSIVASIFIFATGAFMEARLEQGNLRN